MFSAIDLMNRKTNSELTRRDFVRRAACAAVGTVALHATLRDLRLMNTAVAQSNIPTGDYKALICIFLAGGNDSNNLVIPTIQSEWNNYAAIRTPVLALPLSGGPYNVLPINPLVGDGHNYGLHPACPELAAMFNGTDINNTGKLAILFNTGTLVYPLTRAQYQAGKQNPPQLFSHADQVTQWQTSIPDQPPLTGWGGRVADLLASVQPNAKISMSVTLNGANTFEIGSSSSQYAVSTSGAVSLSGVTGNRLSALTNILGVPYSNLQAQAYAKVAAHSINTTGLLNTAILATQDPSNTVQFWNTPFPGSSPFQVTTPTTVGNGTLTKFSSSLGPQLKMIARLIEAGSKPTGNLLTSDGNAMKRQIFFCSVGGYDLHTGQTTGNTQSSVVTGAHANLLAELSQCLNAFQAAMDQIGTLHGDPSFSQRVTSFTASDFSRTFPSNGLGSDHGWGSHHLIAGGAVKGQQTYGTFPTLTVNGPSDTGTGRWIPTTANDQYFATLASWFGVDIGNLSTIFPNIGRFSSTNLGFV
jgi:uncharacterized protein (DUF1501 family)